MENIDLGKSANQLWRESGSTLSFKNWLEREKDKGRFLPNKQLKEFNSFDSESSSKSNQNIIQDVLKEKKQKANPNEVKLGLSKSIIVISITLVLGAIGYNIYIKNKK